jgi:hypothetical protein
MSSKHTVDIRRSLSDPPRPYIGLIACPFSPAAGGGLPLPALEDSSKSFSSASTSSSDSSPRYYFVAFRPACRPAKPFCGAGRTSPSSRPMCGTGRRACSAGDRARCGVRRPARRARTGILHLRHARDPAHARSRPFVRAEVDRAIDLNPSDPRPRFLSGPSHWFTTTTGRGRRRISPRR